jgi:hypothetical protein
VGGGYYNTASHDCATVSGGFANTASNERATVSGGKNNVASGSHATVAGGYADTVAGDYSFATGYEVKVDAAADYTFAFGREFTTSTPNAVIFHNSVDPVRVGIGTTSPGAKLDVGGHIWQTGTGQSVFLGEGAGTSDDLSDNKNVLVGYQTGNSNTTGAYNTFSGYQAGYNNNTGQQNTFSGFMAGYNNTEGLYNTFSGVQAGYSCTTGYSNTFLGYGAGYSNTTNGGNVVIGYMAGYKNTSSNKLCIANDSSDANVLIYGEFDNQRLGLCGVTNPTHTIDVNGGAYCDGANWVNASSRKYKENINELGVEEAVETVNGLKPVRFNYKVDKENECVGFIAEDVPELVATKDRKGMSAMDVVAVLTKVVQNQQKLVKNQQEEIELLKNRIDKLER